MVVATNLNEASQVAKSLYAYFFGHLKKEPLKTTFSGGQVVSGGQVQVARWPDGQIESLATWKHNLCRKESVRDSIVRERYFVRIAEPKDIDDEERAYDRKLKAWSRSVKATLDAKVLMAAAYEGDRALWKP